MNEDVIYLTPIQLANEMEDLVTEYVLLKTGTTDSTAESLVAGRRMMEVIYRLEAVQEVANIIIENVLREEEENGRN